MKQFLVVTIDVEPDCTLNWNYSDPLSFKGVSIGIVERLQPLFNKYNVVPTYLINNVVLEDRESVQVFKQLQGNYELGTHLHPEFMEPQKKYTDYAGKKGAANCCFYEPSIEFEKIKNITDLFRQDFGYDPKSFRAGRFSAGDNTIQSLAKLGYLVDTSVTPNVCWNDKSREKPVDFRNTSEQPYLTGNQIRHQQDGGQLLEVPVSIALKKNTVIHTLKKIIKRPGKPKLYSPVWLRPVYSDINDFQWLLEHYRRKFASRPVVVYNLMFHNVEVIPGLSPYTKTEQDCKAYLDQMEWLFSYCQRNDIQSCSLSQLYEHFHD
jgi:hypothetical protein